jgi:hypothetical protein
MKHDRARLAVNVLSLGLIFGLADSSASLPAHLADGPVIHIEDVAAFNKLYDGDQRTPNRRSTSARLPRSGFGRASQPVGKLARESVPQYFGDSFRKPRRTPLSTWRLQRVSDTHTPRS